MSGSRDCEKLSAPLLCSPFISSARPATLLRPGEQNGCEKFPVRESARWGSPAALLVLQ